MTPTCQTTFIVDRLKEHGVLSSSADQSAPLSAVAYAIRSIIHPPLLREQIPDLLELLAHTDFIRQRAAAEASRALVWQGFYAGQGGDEHVQLLTPEEVAALNRIEDAKRAQHHRTIYIRIVCKCCILHLYGLGTAQPPQTANFFAAMESYFDISDSIENAFAPRFHADLSEKEREELHEAELDCEEFWESASEWQAEREAALKEDGEHQDPTTMSAADGFLDAFPPPVDEEELVETIGWYLQKVEGMVDKLDIVFGDTTVKNARRS
ncbi:hypothetical protein PLICRDRAFT_54728 [Plicaturopsis crispa FD-325 SS-3]|nr:hypothetical protein PLICRDRAFT_54728 [Plicaturopsis crispa FD-325 SS-3]